MISFLDEAQVEVSLCGLLQELGYDYVFGPDIAHDGPVPERGGYEDVVLVERLRKAQEDPERYGNVPVRVAGYSQMFRLIERELQEHIIARTKHVR